jgi:hypothetical protein
VSAFDDYFARMMPDAEAWLAEHAAEPVVARPVVVPGDPAKPLMSGFAHSREHVNGDKEWFAAQVRGNAPEPPPDGFMIPPGLAEGLRATIAELFGIPDEMLEPLPPPTRRQRIRRKLGDWREQAARRAYKSIAGYWPDNGEDDW